MSRFTRVVVMSAAATLAACSFNERVSVDGAGTQANESSVLGGMSADGRFVVFDSIASNLVAGDTNGDANPLGGIDVFVHDRLTGQTERANVDSAGHQANSSSLASPAISDDGRIVAFQSYASNLVAGDTNGVQDVFVRDRETGITRRISVDSAGHQAADGAGMLAVSGNGMVVAFDSASGDLVPGDTNGTSDVFVHDLRTGATERVSVGLDGAEAAESSGQPSLSADGRYVAFTSTADNLVADDTNGLTDVFVYDRRTATTERVSFASGGAQTAVPSVSTTSHTISADGRYVAYESQSVLPIPGGPSYSQIFVYDRETGTTEPGSVNDEGVTANASSDTAALSPDGRFVAFRSTATNLVPTASGTAVEDNLFLRDLDSGTTERVNVPYDGDPTGGTAERAVVGRHGRFVAYESLAANLVPGDTNGQVDIFVRVRIPGPRA